jgi:hypothetical protein
VRLRPQPFLASNRAIPFIQAWLCKTFRYAPELDLLRLGLVETLTLSPFKSNTRMPSFISTP